MVHEDRTIDGNTMPDLKLTDSFNLLFRFVTETKLNIFLTGNAGTGKTTFLKYLKGNSTKKMVVAAPTGVAAINAGGVTIHSLFQLPLAPFIPSGQAGAGAFGGNTIFSQIHYNNDKLNLLRNLELLVIDEVSMVASHTVDAIDTILRKLKKRHLEPFGGTQVLFIGDLHQLPPVVRNQEWEILQKYYKSVFFFDSHVLCENIPVMVELREVFRQRDEAFIRLLNEIRNNELTPDNFELLNSRLKPGFEPTDDAGYVTLTTHNNQADEINAKKLKKLPASPRTYKASVSGDFPINLFPAEPDLELREGAQVMFLRNDTEGKKYFNGKIGIVTGLDDYKVKVKCKDENSDIEVRKMEWKNVNYSLDPDTHQIQEKELGSFHQFPLRLAWAITIHKSQGLTFGNLIVDAVNAFAGGQVYVALSRCTSLEGLVLTSPINMKFLGAHPALKEWRIKIQDDNNLQPKFEEARLQFILQELREIFTWKDWASQLAELIELLGETKADVNGEGILWIRELRSEFDRISGVAEKFRERIEELTRANPEVESNELLQKRVRDASKYFYDEISRWKEKFTGHPLSTDLRKTAKKIDESLEEINFAIHEILFRITACRDGFFLDKYLASGKKFSGKIRGIAGSYAQDRIKGISSKDLAHAELYNRISVMRNRIARQSGMPVYRIFTNNAIKNVCEYLPSSMDDLRAVKGFGRSRAGKYGEEVIGLVKQYCGEKNINPVSLPSRPGQGTAKPDTVSDTLTLFRQGRSIEEIAKERGLVAGTIEAHLAKAMKAGSVGIHEVVPVKEYDLVVNKLPPGYKTFTLTELKSLFPPEISFGKLRMILSWLEREK